MSIEKENKYHRGKIYKIESYSNPEIPPYFGSTVQPLSVRLGKHRASYRCWLNGKYHYVSSFDVISCEDHRIELVKNVFCESKEELTRAEGEYIKANKCVNKRCEGRTKKEYTKDTREHRSVYKKGYYEKNRERLLEKSKQYNIDNRERISSYHKQYNKDNREKVCKKTKEWYAKNRDHLSEKITCDCGSTLSRSSISRHRKTKKHQAFLEAKKLEEADPPPAYEETETTA